MSTPAGRHFLQIPGPTNVPDRILRAIEHPTIDHRGPEFGRLGTRVLAGLCEIFRTNGSVFFTDSRSGATPTPLRAPCGRCLPFGPSPPAFRIDSDFVFSPYCDQGGIMKSPVLKLSGQITSRDPSSRHWVMPIMR